MNNIKDKLSNISIRTELKPGDLGFVIYRHGKLYAENTITESLSKVM